MSIVVADTWRESGFRPVTDDRWVGDTDPSGGDVILLEVAENDLDQANLRAGRNAFGGLLVSLLLHLWLMTNLAGWLLQ